jgi:hypothetical protein
MISAKGRLLHHIAFRSDRHCCCFAQVYEERAAELEQQGGVSAYYHFSSDGKKFKSKWDSYDVDKELERLDQEEEDKAKAEAASKAEVSGAGSVMHEAMGDTPDAILGRAEGAHRLLVCASDGAGPNQS